MFIKPLNNKVLIKLIEDEDNVLALSTKGESGKGEIIAISEEVKSVKVGDKVVFNKYLGEEFEGFKFLKDSDLLGIYEENTVRP